MTIREATEHIETMLLSRADYHPFPKYGESGWDRLPQEAVNSIVGRAEWLNEKPWEALPATLFMEYAKTGNRTHFEKVHFEHRGRLRTLVAAECIEHKGRFIDQIVNGIWAICEETTWAIPAHRGDYSAPNHALVDVEHEKITLDLFAAETGATMAWTLYFLGDQLREISCEIPDRIEYEIEKRIFIPYLTRVDYFWMGLGHNNPVNNWNPWINENVLAAALIACRDEEMRVNLARKIGRSAQRFLDFYAEDGGCDEGPSYFGVAGASMMDVLELYEEATNGKINLFGETLIRNMADYIRHVHIAGDYFVNFADAPMRIGSCCEELLMRVAKKTGNDALWQFARMRLAHNRALRPDQSLIGGTYYTHRTLRALFDWDESLYADQSDTASLGHWFGGIQVATARTAENRFDGLFLAAKGGCNAESHNHNDIGNYVLYAGGEPAIVDAGVGEYTRKTFSTERYTIWSMQSGWHNTAVLNGCDQHEGKAYAARDVSYSDDGRTMDFALDMAAAYVPEAKAEAYRREFVFDRAANTISVHDEVRLKTCDQPTRVPLLCAAAPQIEEGRAVIGQLELRYDPQLFTASVEEKPFNDSKLERIWQQKSLWRLTLTRREKAASDGWTLEYRMAKA